jgi:hypothetical protein
MYCLKQLSKASPIKKELTKVLPAIAVNSNQQRLYSGHQIPDRLKSVPTDANPKFFDMVKKGQIFHEGKFLLIFSSSSFFSHH